MKRRGFFGAIAALIASPVLAKLPVPTQKYFEYTFPELWSATGLADFYINCAAEELRKQIDNDVLIAVCSMEPFSGTLHLETNSGETLATVEIPPPPHRT